VPVAVSSRVVLSAGWVDSAALTSSAGCAASAFSTFSTDPAARSSTLPSSTLLSAGAASVAALGTSGAASVALRPASVVVVVASATRTGRAVFKPSVGPFIATCASGFGFGTNRLGCWKSTGATSLRLTITRAPSLVVGHSRAANSRGSRMQPCEAGTPGSTPSCIATPDQVRRCMKNIGAL
jgi:hypothetical protein